MCIIIDANRCGDICSNEKDYVKPLLKWVMKGGKLVSGGKLEDELFKNLKMRSLLLEWDRSGRIRKFKREDMSVEIEGKCKSDDPHVLALANLSSASIIVTEDEDLISDLKNREIVGFRRKIYKENAASPGHVDHLSKLLSRSGCP